MPKSIILGNGNSLVGFDKYGQVRDFYFPYVGLENQIGGHHSHKLGFWVDYTFSWIDDGSWDISITCEEETLASTLKASNKKLEIEVVFNDVVYNEKNIFIRKVSVTNTGSQKKEIRVFFHQMFELYESHKGDTAYYDPRSDAIIHYKGRRVFLINTLKDNENFDDYSVGLFNIEGREGTHKDAEDGILSKNPIEHGKVDSVVSVHLDLEAEKTKTFYYWMVAGETVQEVMTLDEYVLAKTPEHLLKTTKDFWHAWVNKQNFSFYGLDEGVVKLFKKSLLFMRSHADNGGAIIASGDSDMLQYGRDTYSYMWPRDGAFSAIALDKAGDDNVTRRFFEFCSEIVDPDGYFMHKYHPDKSLGSSWHPWLFKGRPTLPIQEDETALVLFALWEHYELSRDLEFIEKLYDPLIKKTADFMAGHIDAVDEETYLPMPSYDLWEEKFGTTTFTAASVYGALISAGKFAKLLGKTEEEERYNLIAKKIKDSIIKYLYSPEDKMFHKMINFEKGEMVADKTLDMSSIYGIIRFEVLPPSDKRVKDSIRTIEEKLCCKTEIEGVPRYEGDRYYFVTDKVPGNPWFITTLWLAQYYIMQAKKEKDLDEAKKILNWTVKYALPSGILSEQLNPLTGEQISAAPLTWSHSTFVTTVILYLEKLEELGVCKACYPIR